MRQAIARGKDPKRCFGQRLAWLALAINLLGPFVLPSVPAIASGGGEAVVICTERGLRVIVLDETGQERPASRSGESCLFCPPLLKFGGAVPVVAAPIALEATEISSIEYPDAATAPRRIQARFIAAPRAPPLA